MISLHTSPLDQPGTGDAGGMNVYVVELSKQLAGLGIEVDVFTRSTASVLQSIPQYRQPEGHDVLRTSNIRPSPQPMSMTSARFALSSALYVFPFRRDIHARTAITSRLG